MATTTTLNQGSASDMGRLQYTIIAGSVLTDFVIMPWLFDIVTEGITNALTRAISKEAGEQAARVFSRIGKGLMWFQLISMAVDVIDPYGFGSSLNRSRVNQALKAMVQSLERHLRDGLTEILDENEDLTQAEKDRIKQEKFDQVGQTAYAIVQFPKDTSKCYTDANSLTGAPIDGCDIVYKEAYESFKQDKALISTQEVADGTELADLYNAVSRFGVNGRVLKQRDEVLIFMYAFGGFAALVAMFVIWYWWINRGQPS